MFTHFKKLGKHTLIYGSGLLIAKAIGFFLIPLYTHYLTPADYGVLELLDLTGYIIAFLVGFGMSEALLKYYHEYDSVLEKNQVISTALIFTLVVGGIIVIILTQFSHNFAKILLDEEGYYNLFILLFISMFMGILFDLEKTVLRIQDKSILFTVVSLVFTFTAMILNIYFVAIVQTGIKGIFYSTIIAMSLVILYLSVNILKKTGIWFKKDILKKMLTYSLPFIPNGIFAFILMWSDRYIIQYYHGLEMTGYYALGYKLAMIATFLVVTPFELVWNSYIFEIRKREDAKNVYSKVATYYLLMSCFVGVGIAILAYEMVTIMADSSYIVAYTVIPLLVLGMGISTAHTAFQVGLLLEGKSGYLPLSKGIAAIINVLLNITFIPEYGMIGAAYTTVFSYVIYIGLIIYFSQKIYPINYEYVRILKILFITALIYAASCTIPTTDLVISISMKMGLMIMFPIMLVLMKFHTNTELKYMLRGIRYFMMKANIKNN